MGSDGRGDGEVHLGLVHMIEEVGEDVTGFQKGDHIIASWKPGCGDCRYCRKGKAHLCRYGDDPTSRAQDRVTSGDKAIFEFLGVGGFSEYSIICNAILDQQ